MADVQLTTSNYNKTVPQYQVYGTKIYFVWQEDYSGNYQICTAYSNLDGSGFTTTRQTTSATNRVNPHLQVYGSKVYYVYQEIVSGYYALMHAVANLDGTNWSATRLRWDNLHGIYDPQLEVVGDKIYYVWSYRMSSSLPGDALATGISDLDGTNFAQTTQDENSTWMVMPPQLQVVEDKIYYVYTIFNEVTDPYHQIMVASADLNGENFVTTKKTTSAYDKNYPQFQVVSSKIYYVWEEPDATPKVQIWTAIMDTDGSNWSATKRTIDSTMYMNPQLQVTGKLYYTFDNSDQIAYASMKIAQTDWTYENITTRVSAKNNPQLQFVDNKIYFVWSEFISGYSQLWLGGITLETGAITVTTKDASCKDRQSTTLTAIGIITDVEGEYTYRGFEFYEIGTGEYLDSMYAVREIGEFYLIGEFEMTLSGLKPLTCYYIRAFAGSVIGGIFYGGWVICCTTEVPSYDVYEEETTPTICFYVSEDSGHTWSLKFGPYTTDQADIAITKILVRGSGKKQIKFTTDALTGLSASVMCKVDVKI